MEILEFGNIDKKKIILIHGLESPYQIWNSYIDHYKNNYHIIVPILPGHNPKIKEEFTSFKECAKELEEYYISHYGNEVYAIYGMSMGGVLTSYLLENKKLIFKKIIIESSPLLKCNKILTYVLTKQYLTLTHQTQKRSLKTIKKATNSIIPKDKLQEFLELIDNISDKTIINYVNEICNYNFPSNLKINNNQIYYFYGTKFNEILSFKTALYLKKYYPNSNIGIFKGKGHCENSIMHPEVMIKELDKILER